MKAFVKRSYKKTYRLKYNATLVLQTHGRTSHYVCNGGMSSLEGFIARSSDKKTKSSITEECLDQ